MRQAKIGFHQTGKIKGKGVARTDEVVGYSFQLIRIMLNKMKGIEEKEIAWQGTAFQKERNPLGLIVHPQKRKETTQVGVVVKCRQDVLQNLLAILAVVTKTATEFTETFIVDTDVSNFIPTGQEGLQDGNEKGARIVRHKCHSQRPEHARGTLLHCALAKHIARRSETGVGECIEIRRNLLKIARRN